MFVSVRLLIFALLLFVLTDAAFAEAPATAQQTFLTLPVTESDAHLHRLRRLSEAFGRALERRKLRHLPYPEAAALFQKRHSREPRTVSRENIDALLLESQRASRAAAHHHANETKQVVAQAQARGADALESLNRDEAAARAYFGTCLAHIRALVGNEEREVALKVARDCQAAVPDLAPSPHDNPPSVMQVFEDVERAIEAEGKGALSVESEPTDCRVLLNGRLVGTTPYQRQAPIGATYGVQVECGDPRPGRVHELTVKAAPIALLVDVSFERSVRTTRSALRLAYERPDPTRARAHANEVARILGVDEVILLASDDAQAIEVQLLKRGTVVRLSGDGEADIASALDALLTEPPPAPPTVEVAPAPVQRPLPVVEPPQKPPFWLLPAGAALVGTGLVLGSIGAARYREHLEHGADVMGTEIAVDYLVPLRRWRKTRDDPYPFTGVGSALASAGAVMLSSRLPPRHSRWLSPLVAAAAVGVLTWGVVDIAQGEACPSQQDVRPCVRGEQQRDRGGLLAIASAPLLATSIAQLARFQSRALAVHATARSIGATLRF